MSKLFAQTKAREILTEFSIASPPVPIEDIIEGFGIKLELIEANDNYDGQLIPAKRIIRINRLSPKNRQRFTSAHELGHWVLYHQNRLFESYEEPALVTNDNYSPGLESEFSDKQREAEANYFASELLIPAKWIEMDWKKYKQNAKTLSEIYQVSEQALWTKLLDIGAIK